MSGGGAGASASLYSMCKVLNKKDICRKSVLVSKYFIRIWLRVLLKDTRVLFENLS